MCYNVFSFFCNQNDLTKNIAHRGSWGSGKRCVEWMEDYTTTKPHISHVTIENTVESKKTDNSMSFYQAHVKRQLDVFGTVLALILLCIPMLTIAIIIRLTSPGPVFFKQRRYTLDSKPFMLIKFRSMRYGAPVRANKEFSDHSIESYITSIGGFLRKTSLDELPQLFNILHGEMSFIGPRPLADTDSVVLEARKVSGADQVLPGITGLAQINGRNLITDDQKANFDYEYADNCCAREDALIFLKSFLVVLQRTGINHSHK